MEAETDVVRPLTPGNWKIRRDAGDAVSFTFFDGTGEKRARYANADVMAEHHAMALEYADRLEAALEEHRGLTEAMKLGAGERIADLERQVALGRLAANWIKALLCDSIPREDFLKATEALTGKETLCRPKGTS